MPQTAGYVGGGLAGHAHRSDPLVSLRISRCRWRRNIRPFPTGNSLPAPIHARVGNRGRWADCSGGPCRVLRHSAGRCGWLPRTKPRAARPPLAIVAGPLCLPGPCACRLARFALARDRQGVVHSPLFRSAEALAGPLPALGGSRKGRANGTNRANRLVCAECGRSGWLRKGILLALEIRAFTMRIGPVSPAFCG